MINIWDKVFKNGPSKIFKGCLPQILLGPFLNNLSYMKTGKKSYTEHHKHHKVMVITFCMSPFIVSFNLSLTNFWMKRWWVAVQTYLQWTNAKWKALLIINVDAYIILFCLVDSNRRRSVAENRCPKRFGNTQIFEWLRTTCFKGSRCSGKGRNF